MALDLRVPRRLTLASILSLIGAAASIYLSDLYYSLRSGTAGFKSLCNVNQTMNCDTVASSPYAELFAGLPLSSVAAGAFIGLLLVTLVARSFEWRRDAVRIGFFLSFLATLFAVYYFAIMAFKLKTFCLVCLGVDVSAVLLLGIFISLKPAPLSRAPFDPEHLKALIGIPVGAILITVILLKGMDKLGASNASLQEAAFSLLNAPVVALNVSADQPVIGSPDAPITIVEFSDFQCPHCRNGALILKAIQNRHPGQVKVVYKGYPLDSACNRKMERSMHPAACESARAVLCAQDQGRFEALYEKIFEEQEKLKPGVPTQLAKDLGYDMTKFDSCMSAPETAARVTRDVEEAIQLGIVSTPTFYINGRKVEGAFPVPVWSRMVEELLKTAGK